VKVVAKVTVLDRILEDIRKLHRENREVDYVVVTPDEYAELRSDRRIAALMQYPFSDLMTGEDISKATFTTRDFELTDTSRASYAKGPMRYRTYPQGSIHGADIYVLPKEYHPR